MELIDKDALVAEIERVLHFNNSWIEGDKRWQKRTDGISSAYYKRIGSKHTCESFLDFIDTLDVKEVDLEKEIDECLKKHNMLAVGKKDFTEIAKHFFELGMRVNNPITAADRGTAEEIIVNLKRVEQDYHISLTKEIEWVRNKVKKGEL